jgi:hypothetical protein
MCLICLIWGPHSGGHGEYCLLGDNAACSRRNSTDVSEERIAFFFGWRVSEVALLTACFKLCSCLAYYITLKIEAICHPETSADFQRNTRRYVPKYRTVCMRNFMETYFNNRAIYGEILKLTLEHMPSLIMIDVFTTKCYNPEGHGFDSRWGYLIFQLIESIRPDYGHGIDSASNRN